VRKATPWIPTYPVDPTEFRVALAENQTTKQALALSLGLRPSTLSGWLRGVSPAPADLRGRLEHALKLKKDTLKPKENK
jgi:DNA-binding transcriptional regulator YdaS (Cro superfamily)